MPAPLTSSLLCRFLLLGALAVTMAGCTAGFFSKRADKEVFGLLRTKTSKIPNSGSDLLSVTPPLPVDLEKLEKNLTTEDFLGDRAHIEKGASKVDLAQALRFAVSRNRTYLGEKELVYLSALDLTLTRQQFSPIFAGVGTATLNSNQIENGINEFITESTLTTTSAISLSALQRTGTRIAVDLTSDFVKFLTGDLRAIGDSSLAVTVAQPLLRGAGYLAASEVLTQAERDVLYNIRTFTQYRKTFAVDITTQYYRTLQARESARNNYLAYQAFNDSVEREELLAETGVRPTKSFFFQVRQAQLSNEVRWRSAIRAYEQALDDLKIQLGLPVDEPLLLDTDDLTELEIIDPPGSLSEAMTTALVTRLDVWNNRDQVEDADRKIKIATQDLLPRVDTLIGYKVNGEAAGTDRLKFDSRRGNVTAALDVDLNLNQKPNRNALRSAQITEQRAIRERELAEENIRADIRTAWRELELARKQYELAVKGLEIGEERVRLETELLQEGQGTARDLVEAQQDLIDARNGVISTRISHTLARLQLWRDMGVLFIKKDGSWATVLNKETPKGS
jgi:outer membrane protein TolC